MKTRRLRNEAVEIIATWHCNLRCASCAFASPTHGQRFADPEVVGTDLSALSRWLEVEHVRILGGEPLLHPRFLDLVAAVRRARIGQRIRVVTNGVPLARLAPEIWAAVDEIHISLYPSLHGFFERHIAEFTERCREANTELVVKHYDYFRQSFRHVDSDDRLTQRIYRSCQMAHVWRSLTVENGRLYRCLQSAYIQDALPNAGLQARHGEDFLTIGNIACVDELEAWLNRDRALKSCAMCAGSVGRRHLHRQLSPRATDDFALGSAAIDQDYLTTLEASITQANGCITDLVRFPQDTDARP